MPCNQHFSLGNLADRTVHSLQWWQRSTFAGTVGSFSGRSPWSSLSCQAGWQWVFDVDGKLKSLVNIAACLVMMLWTVALPSRTMKMNFPLGNSWIDFKISMNSWFWCIWQDLSEVGAGLEGEGVFIAQPWGWFSMPGYHLRNMVIALKQMLIKTVLRIM